MEIWVYIEQVIIGLLFLLACRQIWRMFKPQTASGCAKGCGRKCAMSHLEKAIQQMEADYK